MNTNEIKQQSVIGAKWLFITNAFNIPASFLLAFFLGRTSPEALGTFGLVQVFIGVITTFVVFGGQSVLRNFMAKVTDPVTRGRMLFAYSLMLVSLMVLMLIVFVAFPGLLSFFWRREITAGTYIFFVFFSLFIINSELFSGAIAGMMNIKASTIAQSATRLLPLSAVAFLFFFYRPFLKSNAWLLILNIYLVSYAVGTAISATALFRDNRFKIKIGTYLPKGFMSFCLTTHLASIFSFIYNDVDRLFMFQLGEMGGLGMYQAVISITRFINYAPHILSAALVPMFSSLLACNDQTAIEKTYSIIQRYSVVTISIISLFTISFSHELLNIFGSEYTDYHYILSMFAFTAVICSLFLGNTAILTSYERNTFRLSVSTLQIIIQLFGTIVFISSYGALAVAGFKALGRIVANIINISYVMAMPLNIKIPRVYLAGISLSGFCFGIKALIVPPGILWSGLMFVGSCLFFFKLGRVTTKDIYELIHIFKKRKFQTAQKAS